MRNALIAGTVLVVYAALLAIFNRKISGSPSLWEKLRQRFTGNKPILNPTVAQSTPKSDDDEQEGRKWDF